jgi:hypothetical protein
MIHKLLLLAVAVQAQETCRPGGGHMILDSHNIPLSTPAFMSQVPGKSCATGFSCNTKSVAEDLGHEWVVPCVDDNTALLKMVNALGFEGQVTSCANAADQLFCSHVQVGDIVCGVCCSSCNGKCQPEKPVEVPSNCINDDNAIAQLSGGSITSCDGAAAVGPDGTSGTKDYHFCLKQNTWI